MIRPGRSHPAMTEQPRMNKRRHESLHMAYLPRTAYTVRQPDSCGSAPEGTTHFAPTQDEHGYDGRPDPKTGTITPIAGQRTTTVTTFCRCATGTHYKPTS